MTRGDFVTVALQGDCAEPCPALVIESDLFDLHPSVTDALSLEQDAEGTGHPQARGVGPSTAEP